MKKKTEHNTADFFEKIFNKALFFLKFRSRSEKEIRDYLERRFKQPKMVHEEINDVIEKTISRLKELNFINDEEFTRSWVIKRLKTNWRGPIVIINELKKKGITQEIINQIFEKEFQESSQDEVLRKLLDKADRRYKHLPYLKRREKLINFAVRRGFLYRKTAILVDEKLKEGVK